MTGSARPDAMGMRHAASQIRSKSDRVAVLLGRIDRQTAAITYVGPAADQFRQRLAAERHRLREVQRILGELADALNQGAASVEADPAGFYGGGRTS